MSTTSPTSSSPWPRLVDIADHLHLLYAPGDDSVELARCDVRMLLEATRKSIEALQDPVSDADLEGSVYSEHESVKAVTNLLRVFHMVLRGLYGDMANAAHDAEELAGEIESLHGPA